MKKIEYLLNDPKKIEEMGIHGRKFVEDNFSWKIITQKFIDRFKKNIEMNKKIIFYQLRLCHFQFL